ncbi:histone-like nucleoid-structuring protein Lsr2 [Corynebacterium dentalis]|uniref:histone-like nucleoid-structuring protein Lsr2 n=1 Tax=Corynebacterium dentalis TaxID=2014528 RepID=UPI002896E2B5|nr:Lsr2 family protein [Corynebacterium dentalis]
MARREVTQFFDDFDNSPLEDNEVNVVEFSVNGIDYVMELSEKNLQKFQSAVDPYIAVARRAARSSSNRKSSSNSSSNRNKRIREWALENNLDVSKRGRIASDIIEKFNQAHS